MALLPSLDAVIPGHAGKILVWPDGTQSNAPYAVLDRAQYGIGPNHLLHVSCRIFSSEYALNGSQDEEFAEDMTRFENARQSDRFVFISGQSRHPFEIAASVREGLQAGKIVVVNDQPKYDIRLDAEQLESILHIRARTTTDATGTSPVAYTE